MHSRNLIKGSLKTIILKLLLDNGRMYGYEITQKTKALSNDVIEITEGALYPTLHKMEADKLLVVEKEMIGKRVRKYYSLTKSGKKETSIRVLELEQFMESLTNILTQKQLAYGTYK